MSQRKLHRLIALFLAALLLMTAPVAVMAQDAEGDAGDTGDTTAEEQPAEGEDAAEEESAAEEPAEEEPVVSSAVRAKVVTGAMPGNQFAQVWLQLVPDFPDATIEIMVDWSVPNAGSKGLQFAVLDPGGLNKVIGGTALKDVSAIAQGNPSFNGADNQMLANLKSGGLTNYTLIMINDGSIDASFTVSVSGATIVDESGQVQEPGAAMADSSEAMDETAGDDAAMAEEVMAEGAAESAPAAGTAPAAAPVAGTAPATSGVVIPPGLPIPAYYYDKPEFYITFIDPALLAGATTAPAAATVADAVAATTTEAADSAEEPAMAEEMMEVVTLRANKLEGALGPDTIHYLGLVSSISDGSIDLSLTFDPQDSREVNVFIVNESDLALLNSGRRLSDVAISAGNRVSNGPQNLRNASFRSSGLGRYTVLVRNSSTSASAEYTVMVEGGILSDDSGQTSTAQAMVEKSSEDEDTSESSAAVASVAPAAPVAAAPAPVAAAPVAAAPAPAAAPAQTTTTTSVINNPTSSSAVAGSAYTIRSGDSISKIARDVYGDVKRYTQICSFNSVADCNRIEVGSTLRLPTQAEMTALAGGSAITAPAASSSTASAPAATTNSSTTTSAPAATTSSASTSSSSDGTGLDIIDTAAAGDNFTILVDAIEKAGLDSALRGNGPFTVFAPTDDAFNALPSSTLSTLLADPGGALTQILLYHVIPGKLLEQDLTDGLTAQTVEGRTVQFGVDRNSVAINDANLIVTDIETSNGVIHVIDSVISPPAANASSSSTAASSAADEDSSAATESAASAAPAASEASAAAAIANTLPVLSDVSALSSEVNDGEVKIIYKTGSAIDEVADFYKAEMSRLDFRTTRAVITARAATLAFTGDDGNVRIGVTEDSTSDSVVVELTVTAP